MTVSLNDIRAARDRIAGGILVSPCPESVPLSELCGARIFCKLEYLQRTGSFKERGARNALLLLSAEEKARGVVAASAGNHALALAYHGRLLGVGVSVVMPKFAPLIKQTTCRRLGANIVMHGENYAEARAHAQEIARQSDAAYIHGFDNEAIVAGAGTVGLELLEQASNIEAVVVPLGGGGLAAGVALAIKEQRPDVLVVGVEAARSPGFSAALATGGPVDVAAQPTLADGLAVGRVGTIPFALAAPRLDRVLAVGEQELSLAVLRLAEMEKSVVEGAGAAPLAAFIAGLLPELRDRRVAVILSGGNIDPLILSRVIEHGLVTDGRLCRFTAVASDRPGGLAWLCGLIAEAGASIKDIAHERAFAGADVATVNVECTVETADAAHATRLFEALGRHGVVVLPPGRTSAEPQP